MENILYAVSYIVTTLFELYIISKFMIMFCGKVSCEKRYVVFAYFIRFVVCALQYMYAPHMFLNLIIGAGTLFLITLCYGSTMVQRMVSLILIYMCLFAAEAVIAGIYALCNIEIMPEGHNGDEFVFVGMSIMFGILYKFVSMFQNIHREFQIPKIFHAAIIILNIIVLMLVSVIFVQENMDKTVKVLSILCLLLVVFLIMYLYDLMAKNYEERMQTEIIEREMHSYHKQVELLQQKGKELSSFRHDINNHLCVIREIMKKDTISAMEYIGQLIEKIEKTRVFSNTGNIAIDSIINYKLSKAQNEGIHVDSNIILPPEMEHSDGDMVTIFGNILDNAFEAAKTTTQPEKYIHIDVKYKIGIIFVNVTNSYDGKINMEDGNIATKKNDKEFHGIGLKSVQSVVDKYHGSMDIEYDEKEFAIKIMLYI